MKSEPTQPTTLDAVARISALREADIFELVSVGKIPDPFQSEPNTAGDPPDPME